MDEWKELIGDFLEEAYSLIENLEEELLNLEKDLTDKSGIDTIFRVAHTIKGGAGAVGFDDVTKLTHIMEDVLDLVRNGKYSFTQDDISLLLEVKDELESLLQAHEKNQEHSFDKAMQLINSLENIKNNTLNEGSSSVASNVSPPTKEDSSEFLHEIDQLPIAARFALTNEDMVGIQESLATNEPLLFIEIRFNEEYELKEVGPFEILNIVNGFTEPIIMNPSPESLDEEYLPYLNIVVASSETTEYIQNKLSVDDVVSKVSVTPLCSDYLQEIEKTMYGDSFLDPSSSNTAEETAKKEPAKESIENSIPPTEQTTDNPVAKKTSTEEEKRKATLKVESSRIDELLNLLGELVIIRSGLNQFGSDLEKSVQNIRFSLRNFLTSSNLLPLHEDDEINIQRNEQFKDSFTLINTSIDNYIEYTQQLSRISTTLQGSMMNLRMVPIQTVFSRFSRLTRDLAKQLNKKIELVMEGGETEIDKGMIDDLYDPLMHMIRNSLDHGIELPEDRKKENKSEKGQIKLKAYQEGDAIFIEIADDGKGIDADKIAQKAIDKEFITSSQAIGMSQQEKLSLIFLPGFSTAEQISNLSGRGVGMDVVHRKIEELGGQVSIISEIGQGSTIRIQLPLTLAIIQGLLILIEGVHYIIPIASVEETIILDPKNLCQLNHYYAIEFREKLIPLLSLPSVLYGKDFNPSMDNQNDNDDDNNDTQNDNDNNNDNKLLELNSILEDEIFTTTNKNDFCIIIRYGNRQVGIVVPEILREQDIVIKPLDSILITSSGIAAATIVGNGEIGFILDLPQIIRYYLKNQK